MSDLQRIDPELAQLIKLQEKYAQDSISLIASENIAPGFVKEATGSMLTDKYAEGYPGKRYYGGCEIVDQIENRAITACKELFGAEHANVQPHAGSQANMGVYAALLQPGDTVLAMNLAAGGHLTHGHPINFSGRLYKFVSYGVNAQTERIDMDEVAQLARQHKPKMIIAGASAYARIIDFPAFAAIAQEIGALFMVDMAHIAGLVAAGIHPSPVPYADIVTSTTHKTLRGPRGGFILCRQQYAAAIDKAIMPGIQGGPCENVIAAKAAAFRYASTTAFKQYVQSVVETMAVLCQELTERGYRAVSGGTDNHLALFDLRAQNITGRDAEELLASIGLFVNRNCIPFDPQSPLITSGMRIGTASVVSRGMGAIQAKEIAQLIDEVLTQKIDVLTASEQILVLTQQFPYRVAV